MKKIFLLLLTCLIGGTFWLLSCSKNKTTECGPFDNRFSSSGMNVNTFRVISYDSIHHYQFDTLKSSDSVAYNKLAIQLVPVKHFYIASTIPQKYHFSIFNEAFACTPPIPYSEEQNDYIKITSDKDFDSLHKSGKDLSDLFDVAIVEKYKNIYYYRMSLKDYMALQPTTKDELILLLNKGPELSGKYSFQIEYSRTLNTDQKIFTATSLNVFLSD